MLTFPLHIAGRKLLALASDLSLPFSEEAYKVLYNSTPTATSVLPQNTRIHAPASGWKHKNKGDGEKGGDDVASTNSGKDAKSVSASTAALADKRDETRASAAAANAGDSDDVDTEDTSTSTHGARTNRVPRTFSPASDLSDLLRSCPLLLSKRVEHSIFPKLAALHVFFSALLSLQAAHGRLPVAALRTDDPALQAPILRELISTFPLIREASKAAHPFCSSPVAEDARVLEVHVRVPLEGSPKEYPPLPPALIQAPITGPTETGADTATEAAPAAAAAAAAPGGEDYSTSSSSSSSSASSGLFDQLDRRPSFLREMFSSSPVRVHEATREALWTAPEILLVSLVDKLLPRLATLLVYHESLYSGAPVAKETLLWPTTRAGLMTLAKNPERKAVFETAAGMKLELVKVVANGTRTASAAAAAAANAVTSTSGTDAGAGQRLGRKNKVNSANYLLSTDGVLQGSPVSGNSVTDSLTDTPESVTADAVPLRPQLDIRVKLRNERKVIAAARELNKRIIEKGDVLRNKAAQSSASSAFPTSSASASSLLSSSPSLSLSSSSSSSSSSSTSSAASGSLTVATSDQHLDPTSASAALHQQQQQQQQNAYSSLKRDIFSPAAVVTAISGSVDFCEQGPGLPSVTLSPTTAASTSSSSTSTSTSGAHTPFPAPTPAPAPAPLLPRLPVSETEWPTVLAPSLVAKDDFSDVLHAYEGSEGEDVDEGVDGVHLALDDYVVARAGAMPEDVWEEPPVLRNREQGAATATATATSTSTSSLSKGMEGGEGSESHELDVHSEAVEDGQGAGARRMEREAEEEEQGEEEEEEEEEKDGSEDISFVEVKGGRFMSSLRKVDGDEDDEDEDEDGDEEDDDEEDDGEEDDERRVMTIEDLVNMEVDPAVLQELGYSEGQGPDGHPFLAELVAEGLATLSGHANNTVVAAPVTLSGQANSNTSSNNLTSGTPTAEASLDSTYRGQAHGVNPSNEHASRSDSRDYVDGDDGVDDDDNGNYREANATHVARMQSKSTSTITSLRSPLASSATSSASVSPAGGAASASSRAAGAPSAEHHSDEDDDVHTHSEYRVEGMAEKRTHDNITISNAGSSSVNGNNIGVGTVNGDSTNGTSSRDRGSTSGGSSSTVSTNNNATTSSSNSSSSSDSISTSDNARDGGGAIGPRKRSKFHVVATEAMNVAAIEGIIATRLTLANTSRSRRVPSSLRSNLSPEDVSFGKADPLLRELRPELDGPGEVRFLDGRLDTARTSFAKGARRRRTAVLERAKEVVEEHLPVVHNEVMFGRVRGEIASIQERVLSSASTSEGQTSTMMTMSMSETTGSMPPGSMGTISASSSDTSGAASLEGGVSSLHPSAPSTFTSTSSSSLASSSTSSSSLATLSSSFVPSTSLSPSLSSSAKRQILQALEEQLTQNKTKKVALRSTTGGLAKARVDQATRHRKDFTLNEVLKMSDQDFYDTYVPIHTVWICLCVMCIIDDCVFL